MSAFQRFGGVQYSPSRNKQSKKNYFFYFFLGCLTHEVEGTKFLHDVGNHSPNTTAPVPEDVNRENTNVRTSNLA
jgi:hypothetical protein